MQHVAFRPSLIRQLGAKNDCLFYLQVEQVGALKYGVRRHRRECCLTNHLKFGATTIARIYKERWQIELFFKH